MNSMRLLSLVAADLSAANAAYFATECRDAAIAISRACVEIHVLIDRSLRFALIKYQFEVAAIMAQCKHFVLPFRYRLLNAPFLRL